MVHRSGQIHKSWAEVAATFTNAQVLNEFANNEGLLVTPPNSITFLTGIGAVMTYGLLRAGSEQTGPASNLTLVFVAARR